VEVIIMKKVILWSMVAVLLAGTCAARASDKEMFWGALLGAGAGWLLADSVDGVHSSAAVPIGAIAGGLLVRELDRTADRYEWHDSAPGGHDYFGGQSYDYRGDRARVAVQRKIEAVAPRAKKKTVEPAKAPDYHPGVDVVKVEVQLVTGTRMDVRLLRMPNDVFVGPQGEIYTTLPRASELTRYSGVVKQTP
jgi:hypothetical protein